MQKKNQIYCSRENIVMQTPKRCQTPPKRNTNKINILPKLKDYEYNPIRMNECIGTPVNKYIPSNRKKEQIVISKTPCREPTKKTPIAPRKKEYPFKSITQKKLFFIDENPVASRKINKNPFKSICQKKLIFH